jgi:HrpA-like RNA helicase
MFPAGPGHCYRLFSSAHYNDTMPRHSPPEIVNTALEGVVLVLKAMGVDKVSLWQGQPRVFTIHCIMQRHVSHLA